MHFRWFLCPGYYGRLRFISSRAGNNTALRTFIPGPKILLANTIVRYYLQHDVIVGDMGPTVCDMKPTTVQSGIHTHLLTFQSARLSDGNFYLIFLHIKSSLQTLNSKVVCFLNWHVWFVVIIFDTYDFNTYRLLSRNSWVIPNHSSKCTRVIVSHS